MKKILIILMTFLVIASCTKLEDLNKDTKRPTAVPGVTLFSNAQVNLAKQIASTNVNMNVFKLWAQYWTETTYTDESNYDIVNRTIADNAFREWYRDVLMDLKDARMIIGATTFATEAETLAAKNQLLIIDIHEVFVYERLVTLFGNVPYTEALDIDNIQPKYDDAMTIYKDLLVRLDTDIAGLSTGGTESFGTADLVYGGDVSSWILFANSLKLKMGTILSDVDATLAATTINSAIAGGVISSNADNAEFYFLAATPNTNPLYVDLTLSGRQDFVGTTTMLDDVMTPYVDPRMTKYFKGLAFVYDEDDAGDPVDTNLEGEGNVVLIYRNATDENDSLVPVELPFMVYAADASNPFTYNLGGFPGRSNPYVDFSKVGDVITTDPTFPCLLISYSEVEFYLAEAAARADNDAGTIEHYNAGITASFDYWSVAGADDYIASDSVTYDPAKTWEEQIGTQSWIAFYNNGYLGWTVYRRLGFPIMPVAEDATISVIPTRFTYPIDEQTLNPANYAEASAAIGGDLLTTKLWFEK
jgi:hypothetical protein